MFVSGRFDELRLLRRAARVPGNDGLHVPRCRGERDMSSSVHAQRGLSCAQPSGGEPKWRSIDADLRRDIAPLPPAVRHKPCAGMSARDAVRTRATDRERGRVPLAVTRSPLIRQHPEQRKASAGRDGNRRRARRIRLDAA